MLRKENIINKILKTIPAFQNKTKKFFQYFIEALRGSERDLTETKLGFAIFFLSVPMVLEMIMESLFAIVDIYFVSKLGSAATATVGLTESMITIIYAVNAGLSAATVAIVSRRIGEKKHDDAAVAAFQAIVLSVVVSIFFTIIGIFFSEKLLGLMGASEDVIKEGSKFTAIMLGGNITIVMLFVINAIFRSAGDAAISMRALWLANGLNIILDPCFIFGWWIFPEMGVAGAAVATNIGRGVAVAYQLYMLFKGGKHIQIKLIHFKIRFKIIKNMVKLSMGGIGQSLIATISWLAMIRMLSVFGKDVVAGYTIAIRVIIFLLLPSWGLSNAAATLVGQNLGANRPDRAEKVAWITGFINFGFLGIISIFTIWFAPEIIRFFTNDEALIIAGIKSLRIVSLGFIGYGFGMVIMQSFNGAGNTKTPTLINLLWFWCIEIPLAYLLSMHTPLNENGVYWAIVIAEVLLALHGIILFKKGDWKLQKV